MSVLFWTICSIINFEFGANMLGEYGDDHAVNMIAISCVLLPTYLFVFSPVNEFYDGRIHELCNLQEFRCKLNPIRFLCIFWSMIASLIYGFTYSKNFRKFWDD